jgi:hypothetical protein
MVILAVGLTIFIIAVLIGLTSGGITLPWRRGKNG